MSYLNQFAPKKTVAQAQFATVIDIVDGVKIKIDGESQARDIYYNSLITPAIGDRVYFTHVSGTILIIGKLQYKRGNVNE